MPLKFHSHRLPNGLEILAEENADAHSFAAGLFVRTGSRDEEPGLAGVSHFLEHMMFKGSSQYGWEDVNRIFDEMGARYNAYTTQEMTAYYANVLEEFTERTIEHLSHLLRPAIRQADFDTEKKVILEEIAMYLDDPGHRVYEALMEAHFGPHPLARSVLGTAKSIAALRRDEMADYFQRHYGPGNMVLSATGRMDFPQLLAWAEKYCGQWPAGAAPRHQPPPTYSPSRRELTDGKLSRQYTMAMMPGPSAQDERRFAARVLADVVGDAEGSRYYWSLVDNAIVEEAELGFYPHDQCGSFYISLVSEPDRARRAMDIALAELNKVKHDLTEEEVERTKNKIGGGLVLQGEAPMGRMRAIGNQWVYNGEYRSLEQEIASLNAVTADSLRSLMVEFPFEPMTVMSLGPVTEQPIEEDRMMDGLKIAMAGIVIAGMVRARHVCAADNPPAATQPAKTGELNLTFSQRSPLSDKKELAARLNLVESKMGDDYDLAQCPFKAYVPTNYDPGTPVGLFVFLDYKATTSSPPAWWPVLEKNHLIFISPVCHSGDVYPPSVPLWQSVGLALDAVENLKRQYAVDGHRLYLMAMGTKCTLEALSLSDVFDGFVLQNDFAYFRGLPWGNGGSVPANFTRPPSRLISDAAQRGFFVMDTGTDPNRTKAINLRVAAMKADRIDHVQMAQLSLGDDLRFPHFKAEWFQQQALPFLDAVAAKQADTAIQPLATAAPATGPAAPAPSPDANPAQHLLRMGKLYIANHLPDLARQKFQAILDVYPSDPAAKEAKELLDQLNQP